MSNGIAVSILPDELRLMVARTNGSVQPLHQVARELPADAVHAGLHAPNLPDPDVVVGALRELVEQVDAGRERGEMVALLIPDAAVRMALVPLEGASPSRGEGESMARWALRDLLPVEAGEARIDWAVIDENGGETPSRWLLAIGADAAVVREYEAIVEGAGWSPGRVLPLTMGLAVGAGHEDGSEEAFLGRVVLNGFGERAACLVEAGGVPRLHRAWRGANLDLGHELTSIERYAAQRLDLSIAEAIVAGPPSWREAAAADCEARGWTVRVCSRWAAHIGAVQP